MTEDSHKKPQATVRPLSNRLVAQEAVEDGRTGKVSIDRYLEALRKGVMLSQ